MLRNRRSSIRPLVLLSAALVLSPAARSDEPADFAHDVLPILRARCVKCHSAGKTEGDLSMESRQLLINAEVIVPGDAAFMCRLSMDVLGLLPVSDTFDPKHYEPFEIGLPSEKIISTYPAIDTVVDNVKISEGLENIATVLDRGTLIRSHILPDLGNILHSRHQCHWHTGYVPPQTVAAPHLGAWMAKILGPRNPAIPAFIDIGQRLEDIGEREELKAFHTADERPCLVTKDPISVTDLHATILTAMGISPRTSFEIEQRPFYITEDGKGKVAEELFA